MNTVAVTADNNALGSNQNVYILRSVLRGILWQIKHYLWSYSSIF